MPAALPLTEPRRQEEHKDFINVLGSAGVSFPDKSTVRSDATEHVRLYLWLRVLWRQLAMSKVGSATEKRVADANGRGEFSKGKVVAHPLHVRPAMTLHGLQFRLSCLLN